MNDVIKDLLYSYEERVSSLGAIFDDTLKLLEVFQDSESSRRESERVSGELRECLARIGSLRRKDFDAMMRDILRSQEEHEREVKDLLSCFMNEQKMMVRVLKENLEEVKEIASRGEVPRLREIKEKMKDVARSQEERKKQVVSMLEEYREEQKSLASSIREFLGRGRQLRSANLKLLLNEFRALDQQRKIQTAERREKVRAMLAGFREERLEAAGKRKEYPADYESHV